MLSPERDFGTVVEMKSPALCGAFLCQEKMFR